MRQEAADSGLRNEGSELELLVAAVTLGREAGVDPIGGGLGVLFGKLVLEVADGGGAYEVWEALVEELREVRGIEFF